MFTERLKTHPVFRETVARLSGRPSEPVVIGGVVRSATGLFLAALGEELDLPHLVITPGQEEAEEVLTALSVFGAREYVYLPPYDVIPFEPISPAASVVGARIKALYRVYAGASAISTVEAVLRRLPPPDAIEREALIFERGSELNLSHVEDRLPQIGYKREDMVEAPGMFSRRGGILDVFPPTEPNPVRVEFFGDAIESVRSFEVTSQRRIAELDRMDVFPAKEIILTPGTKKRLLEEVNKRFDEAVGAEVEDALYVSGYFEGIENLLPFAYPATATLLDYFPRSPLIVLFDRAGCLVKEEEVLEELSRLSSRADAGFPLPRPEALFANLTEILETNADRSGPSLVLAGSFEGAAIPGFDTRSSGFFGGRVEDFARETARLRKRKTSVVVTYERPDQPDLFQGIVEARDPGFDAAYVRAYVGEGFVWEEAGVAVYPARSVISKRPAKPSRHRRFPVTADTTKIGSPFELKPGDLIVHMDHGIGRYVGLEELTLPEGSGEYLTVEYAEGNRLYVPVYNLRFVQKYAGGDPSRVPLSRLGGPGWQKSKARAKKAAEKMARQLIEIYAARTAMPGIKFQSADELENELADSFPFVETPDQARAIKETYADMAGEKPMDRLICADVGFGKTEVAVRAALRCIAAGKQVAFLAPTTILVEQHYNTFKDRLSPFPIIIETLSRFKRPRDMSGVLLGLAEGKVDIVIGTHRLLSDDVVFRDLGLLIVDEEQRFGVRHKEKIKAFKKYVDVLTLTATPIPRTLYMAFSGLRDLSLINTPPVGRLPIHTYVAPYDETLIVEAIRKELARGGQVFVVHNRVRTLNTFAGNLEELMPDVRFAVAHGQMDDRELEDVMLRFLVKEVDVLVSSSIIESGLDMPNVNTIIIDRADRFGLSQLHQLRGRVGRSHERAYAYLLTAPSRSLTDSARERLLAVKESTELGSGFRLATRDLEIRGAGNLLGHEQHGHVEAVGLDMYIRLLAEAVTRLKGQKPAAGLRDLNVNSSEEAYLPVEYVPGERQRLDLYKRISEVTTPEGLEDISLEMRDRFGPIAAPARRLLELQEIRITASEAPVKAVFLSEAEVEIELERGVQLKPEQVPPLEFVSRVELKTGIDNNLRMIVGIIPPYPVKDAAVKIIGALGGITSDAVYNSSV